MAFLLHRRGLSLLVNQSRNVRIQTDLRPRQLGIIRGGGGGGGAPIWRRHQNNQAKINNGGDSSSNGANGSGNSNNNSNGNGNGRKTESEPEPIDVPVSLWYQRLGPATHFAGWFHRTQSRRPLTVQVVMALITYLAGDLLAQKIGGEGYSPWRTARMLTIGAIAAIPGYKWFLWLGSRFNYPSKWRSVLVKTCVQQAVFPPIFATYFFTMQAVLTGESPSGVVERVKAAVPVSMWNSLKLWPTVTAFSFAFIMPEYRFMFTGIFAVLWQAYLSFLNRSEEKLERAGGNVARKLKEINEPLQQEKMNLQPEKQ